MQKALLKMTRCFRKESQSDRFPVLYASYLANNKFWGNSASTTTYLSIRSSPRLLLSFSVVSNLFYQVIVKRPLIKKAKMTYYCYTRTHLTQPVEYIKRKQIFETYFALGKVFDIINLLRFCSWV